MELQEGNLEEIKARIDELSVQRRTKQPIEFPSAGSTFKRPEGYFAGKLIQDADLRGYQVGGAQVSEKHCGFVINAGGATADDVLAVMRHVRDKVKEKSGVTLEPEVRVEHELIVYLESCVGAWNGEVQQLGIPPEVVTAVAETAVGGKFENLALTYTLLVEPITVELGIAIL